ncbi:hypothetical protein QUF74_16590 [Candidatus Halobeggiatoa sp. HSG11]|nr:hypothetical protein [Candidatus Halobeggiatoa sp. HSG11]
MKKTKLFIGLAISALSLPSHSLFAAVTIDSPRISGERVDRCMVEYGEDNCSKWGTEQAANALCRKIGHKNAARWWWFDGDSKKNVGTYRLTHTKKNGQFTSYWDWCGKCDYYFTKIKCNQHQ